MDRTNQDETTAARTRMPRHARERQMIEAAIESFGIQGFHGASMDQIAVDAGISKPMLYAYFDSAYPLRSGCPVVIGYRGFRRRVVDRAKPEQRLEGSHRCAPAVVAEDVFIEVNRQVRL